MNWRVAVIALILRSHVHAGQQEKADSTPRSSQAVPHPSTNRALRRLTSEVRRDPVHSTRYGRQRMIMLAWFQLLDTRARRTESCAGVPWLACPAMGSHIDFLVVCLLASNAIWRRLCTAQDLVEQSCRTLTLLTFFPELPSDFAFVARHGGENSATGN